jgi:glycosyltransferase involved in cell wall biosynthesis
MTVIERGETWCLSTKGASSTDEARIRRLLQPLDPRVWPFDRSSKLRSGLRLLRDVLRHRPALVVLEGTGFGGGIPLMTARLLGRTRYLVSSGDAVAPILALRSGLVYPLALAYEVLLYRLSAGFIGWTPYLAGRALTFGAPRAMTAENWSLAAGRHGDRAAVRTRLGVPDAAVVFGIVGSLVWTPRRNYCYGKELVAALRHCTRSDVRVLIVGDGTGFAELQSMLAEHPDDRVILTGAVAHEEVPSMLSAMDVASLPQSMDAVGMFRYTTKLSEYVAAGLPVVTGQLPFAYDLDDGWLWRLPGAAPWDGRYERALGALMEELTQSEIEERASHATTGAKRFDGPAQQRRVSAFVTDILTDGRRAPQPL